MNSVKHYLGEFLKDIANDDFARAESNLKSAINEKLKTKMSALIVEKKTKTKNDETHCDDDKKFPFKKFKKKSK